MNNQLDDLRDLVRFLQFIRREKHPWWSIIFNKGKVAGWLGTLLKVTLIHRCNSSFLNRTNSTNRAKRLK